MKNILKSEMLREIDLIPKSSNEKRLLFHICGDFVK